MIVTRRFSGRSLVGAVLVGAVAVGFSLPTQAAPPEAPSGTPAGPAHRPVSSPNPDSPNPDSPDADSPDAGGPGTGRPSGSAGHSGPGASPGTATTGGAAGPRRAGSVVRTTRVPAANRLFGAGRAWNVWYRSTSWTGRPTVVSGTVSVPAGKAPRDGWPVVSFGHGLGGVADACAPSRTGPSPWERAVQEALLGAGYAVAVSDYEGIGTPGPASIGHGRATAQAMIDIVRATRQLAPASRDWAAVGYSLGGQAALFAGAVARDYAPELRARGVVGMAAISQWKLLLEGGSAPAAQVWPSAPFSMLTWGRTYGGKEFSASVPLTARGAQLTRLAGTTCIDELVTTMAGITNAEFYRDSRAAAAAQAELMAPHEIPVAELGGRAGIPVRLAHGTEDPLPMTISQLTAEQLTAAGADAQFLPVEGADHITLQPTIAPRVVEWVAAFFG